MRHKYGEIISFYVSVFKKILPTAAASLSSGFKKESIGSLVLYEYLRAPQRWGVAVR